MTWRKPLGWFVKLFEIYEQYLTNLLNRVVRESGGLEETRNLAKKHAGQAVEALSRYPVDLLGDGG